MKRKPGDEIDLVLRAASFAAHKHREQRRKDTDATPYINHPLAVACVLAEEGGVQSPEILAAALLHDTIEDTDTTYDELRGRFGARIADVVAEVTDTKFLGKRARKELQVAKAGRSSEAAKLVKIADMICNPRDVLASPPAEWSVERKQEYFEFAKQVVDRVRGGESGARGPIRSALCAAAGSATLKSGCSRHLSDQRLQAIDAILSA